MESKGNNFKKDISFADWELDKFILPEFKKRGYEVVEKAQGNFPDYDIIMKFPDGNNYKVEVKEDIKGIDTGRVAWYEVSNNQGKPKGIKYSKADFLIYVNHSSDNGVEAYLFKREDILLWLEDEATLKTKKPATHRTSCFYLYYHWNIRETFTPLFNIPEFLSREELRDDMKIGKFEVGLILTEEENKKRLEERLSY